MRKSLLLFAIIFTLFIGIVSADWVYQESANITTSSGSWVSGANPVDGNWGTYGYSPPASYGYKYLNYTKPEYSTSSTLWTIKDAGTTTNLSITQACWDYYTDDVYLRLISEGTVGFDSFEEGTMVNTPSGMVAVEDLNINDTVYGYNGSSIVNDTIQVVGERATNETIYLITVDGTLLNVTNITLFYTQRGYVYAPDLTTNDTIFNIDETYHNVTDISTKEYSGNVYDFNIKDTSHFFVEGYLVHNYDNVWWDCYDGTWDTLRTYGHSFVYEEAIVWDVDVPYFEGLSPLPARDYFIDEFDDASVNSTIWDNQGCSEVTYNGKGMLLCDVSLVTDEPYIYTKLSYLGFNMSQPFVIRYNASRYGTSLQHFGVAVMDRVPIKDVLQWGLGSNLYNGDMLGQWFYSTYNVFDSVGNPSQYYDSSHTWAYNNQDFFVEYEFHYDGTRCWVEVTRPDTSTYVNVNATCNPTNVMDYLGIGDWTAGSYDTTNHQFYVDYIEIDQTPPPTQTPNPPTDLNVYNIQPTSLVLNSSVDCQEKCIIYQDGVNVFNWSNVAETVYGLTPSTSYLFKYSVYNSTYDIPESDFSNTVNPTTLVEPPPLDGEIELGTTGGTQILAGFNVSGNDAYQYSAMGFQYHDYPTTYITGVNLFTENEGTEDIIISFKEWNSSIRNTWDNMTTLATTTVTPAEASATGFNQHNFDTPYQINNDTQYYVFFTTETTINDYWVGRIMSGYGGTSDGVAWRYNSFTDVWTIYSTNAWFMNVTYEASPCLSSWTPFYTTCTIGDNQTLWYNDTNSCSPPTGIPVDNGTVSSCNYCTLSYTTQDTICLSTYEIITYPTYNNFGSCCNITSIPADCDLPANTSVTCVGAYESGDVDNVVVDFFVELGRKFVEFAPIIVIITLAILGLGYFGIKKFKL